MIVPDTPKIGSKTGKINQKTLDRALLVTDINDIRKRIFPAHALRQLFRYRQGEFLVDRLNLFPKPFLLALWLRLSCRGSCSFKDKQGNRQQITFRFLAGLLGDLIRDGAGKFFLLRRLNSQVDALWRNGAVGSPKKRLDPTGVPVYLRTDLSFGLRSGGSVAHMAGVLNHLGQFTAEPVSLSTGDIPTARKDLTVRHLLPASRFWDYRELPCLESNETFVRQVVALLEGKKISFFYQRYSVYNVSALTLSERYRVPWVLEYNGSEVWMNRHWYRPLKYESLAERIELLNLRRADVIVVVSRPMKDECVARGIEAEKILVNPNGVDPDRYCPEIDGSQVRRLHGLEGKTVVGFIGTFGKWHGAEVLAEAFGLLLRTFPHYRERVRLLMIGDGVTRPLVEAHLERSGASECSVLTGLVPQERGPEYLAACDLLVASHQPNPDGSPFFGSPTKLFEYMAMGKGIVASDLGQIGEVLKHDQTAWLVKPGDVQSLILGLKELIDHPEKRERMGRAARQEAVARYTWKEHTRRIVEKLRERCS